MSLGAWWLMDVCSMDTANIYKGIDWLATGRSRSGRALLPQNFPSKCENKAGTFRRPKANRGQGAGPRASGFSTANLSHY